MRSESVSRPLAGPSALDQIADTYGLAGTKLEIDAAVATHQRAACAACSKHPQQGQIVGRNTIQFMTTMLVMSETLPLSSVKAHLSELVDRVEDQHDRVVITRNGKPAAVLVSPDDLESLEETLAILSDPSLMAQIRESEHTDTKPDPAATLHELQARLHSRHDTAA